MKSLKTLTFCLMLFSAPHTSLAAHDGNAEVNCNLTDHDSKLKAEAKRKLAFIIPDKKPAEPVEEPTESVE